MTDAIVVCEGQSEEAFVNRILYPALLGGNVLVQPRLIPTSRHAKGGAFGSQRVLRFLRNTIRERSDTYVTTFFDLYKLPSDFPGAAHTDARSDPLDQATQIEDAFRTAVVQEAGCRKSRFLPHIQPYEFEALLFSDVSKFAETEPKWRAFADALKDARQSSNSPEHINDGENTHPSARLQCLTPPYKKVLHGTAVSKRIGIERMRAECRHFNRWVRRLEVLPPLRA